MPKIITIQEFRKNEAEILREIRNGAIFIYPTDTIYGLGCDATNSRAVEKVRKAKQRDSKPYSVIAPSKEWIKKNCIVDSKQAKKWLNMLPGPFTLILKLKCHKCVAKNVTGNKALGIRIPDNWSAMIAKDLNCPIVTTSANLSGEAYMTSLDDLNEIIKDKVDLIIYEGEKRGRPSTVVNLTENKPAVVKR